MTVFPKPVSTFNIAASYSEIIIIIGKTQTDLDTYKHEKVPAEAFVFSPQTLLDLQKIINETVEKYENVFGKIPVDPTRNIKND